MRRWSAVSVVMVGLVGLVAPTDLRAGSLGDFSESYDETKRSNQGRDDSEDDDDSDRDYYTDDGCGEDGLESCDEYAADADDYEDSDDDLPGIVRMLVGATPGAGFSLGAGPYAGRGRRASKEIDELSDSGVAGGAEARPGRVFDGSVGDETYQWTLRSNALVTARGDAAGGEIFSKVTSSKMPGFALSYQYAHELRSRSDLGLMYLVYEPNIALLERWTVSWNLGFTAIHSRSGVGDPGLSFGLATEVFPVDPLLIAARTHLHHYFGVSVGDLRGAFGVFLSDHVALEANLRYLGIFGGADLTSVGFGVRTYVGF